MTYYKYRMPTFDVKKSSLLATVPSLILFDIASPTDSSFPYSQAQSMCLYPHVIAASTAFLTSVSDDCVRKTRVRILIFIM